MKKKKVLKRQCDQNEEGETPSKKECSDFTVVLFLKKLRTGECFEALEEFVKLCPQKIKKNNDLGLMFFKEGGKLMDILTVLDHGGCTDSFQVSKVFAALHRLLLRVLSKAPEQKHSAEEMCNRLLSSYLEHVNKHLNAQSAAELQKVVLQLLTVMVSLNVNLAKFILSNVTLTVEDANQIVAMVNPLDKHSVRTCFINFLMAFLVEENAYVINLLLQKRYILTSIIPGLPYDTSHLATFVLNTLRTKIVESFIITKTVKIFTFNTRVVCQLLDLYEWKGPAGHIGRWEKISSEEKMDVDVDEEQLNIVAEAAHSLIVTLCTSIRYGVLFRDRSLGFGERRNPTVASILMGMKEPWEHKLRSDLVCKIVQACSEMARIPYLKVNNVIEIRETEAWIKIISFVIQIISAVDLSDIVNLKPDLALQAVKALVCPGTFLAAISSGVTHTRDAIRHKSVLFYQAVLKASESARSVLPEVEASLLDGHIRKFLPDGAALESSWHMCAREEFKISAPHDLIPHLSNYDQMFSLLDLMFLYQHHYLSLLDFVSKYVSLGSSLIVTLDFENSRHSSILKLKVQVLQILILMDTDVLDPGEPGFSKAVTTLLHCGCHDRELAPEALSILGSILVKYGVLDSTSVDFTDELEVWIHCCQIAPRGHQEEILSFLQKIVIKVATNPLCFIDKISDSVQETSSDTCSKKHVSLVDLAERIFQELLKVRQDPLSSNETTTDSTQKEKLYFDNTIIYEVSALLMGVLEHVESEKIHPSVQKYLSFVLVHLLHMQIDPTPFLSVTKHWSSMPEGVANYIYGWLGEQPVALGDPFGKYSPECSLSRFFLQSNRAVPEVDDSIHPISVLLKWRLVVFHMIQLAERQQLTETIVEGSSDVIVSLFEALRRLSEEENQILDKTQFKLLSSVFKHQSLVNYFSPVIENENCTEAHVTNFLLNILRKINKYPEIFQNRSLTELLRKKCYQNITFYLSNPTNFTGKTNFLVSSLECLHLSNNEKQSLIGKILPCMFTNPWNELLVYLLDHVDVLHSHMKSIGSKLSSFLKDRTITDKSAGWIMSNVLSRYIEKFPSTAHHLPNGLIQRLTCKEGINLAVVMFRHRSDNGFRTNLKKILGTFLECLLQYPKILFQVLENYCETLLKIESELSGKSIKKKGKLKIKITKEFKIELLYKYFGEDIEKAMQLPLSIPDYLTENSSIKTLVQRFMDEKTCEYLSDSLDKNYRNLGLCLPFHLSVIDGLHKRGAWVQKPSSLAKLLLHQLTHMLKEKAPYESIIHLCTIFIEVLTNNQNKWDSVFEPDKSWLEIPALFLKLALKESEKKEENLSLSILSVLNNLLWKCKCSNFAKLVFQMTASHSRFLDIVLKREVTGIKLAILQIVLVCYQISPQLMKSVHIPVWLGAYGASLSHCDQLILKILHCMNENKEINLHDYRPFLWGEAAVNHYSIRATAGMSLWRVPPATAAIELLNMEMVEHTIARFPIYRELLLVKDVSETNEMSNNWCSESLHNCVPEVYDPAFILPLFNHLMAPESVLDDYKFCRLGGLALTLVCLGSMCKNTRAAALCVIARFYNHVEMRNMDMRRKFEMIYKHFLEVLRCGLRDLKNKEIIRDLNLRKQERERARVPGEQDQSEVFSVYNDVDIDNSESDVHIEPQKMEWMCRLPSFTSSFLAKASLIILNPMHTMYCVLHRFFRAKPIMNLATVPDLLELIRNSSLEYRYYQQWLLETILAGMRDKEDVYIANNNYLFIMLFFLFSCSLSDPRIKVLILQIIEAAIKLEGVNFYDNGFIPWLYASCTQVHEANNGRLTLAFIRLLVSVSADVTIPIKKAVPLLLNLPRQVDCEDLLPILQLVKVLVRYVSKEHLVIVLRLCYKILDQDVIENYARELFILPSDITSPRNIKESGESDDTTKATLNSENKDLLYEELRNVINAYVLGKKKELTHKCS